MSMIDHNNLGNSIINIGLKSIAMIKKNHDNDFSTKAPVRKKYEKV